MKFACPNCGADINYDINKKMVHCDHCNQDFDASTIKSKKKIRYKTYTCSSCGAELAVSEQENTVRCAYCQSQELISNNFDDEIEPEGIIPFKYTREQFVEHFKNHISRRKFTSQEFKDGIDYNNVLGMYVPAYIYRTFCEGKAFYIIRNDDYTSYHRCDFEEEISIITDANQTIDDDMMKNLSPYDINQIKPFSLGYVAGFSILRANDKYADFHSNVDMGTIFAEQITMFTFPKIMYKEKIIKKELVYFPIWSLKSNYQGKKYVFYVNGVTGRVVGEIPLKRDYWGGIIKFVIFFGILFVFVGLFGSAIFQNNTIPLIFIGIAVAAMIIILLFTVIYQSYTVNKNRVGQYIIHNKKFKRHYYFSKRRYEKDLKEAREEY